MCIYIHVYTEVCVCVCVCVHGPPALQSLRLLSPQPLLNDGFLYTWCSEPQTTHMVLYRSQRKERVTATYELFY